ncbi:MAG: hypothetical protein H0V18_04115 [Pyrinomonadaceae bacterium]|nr:hypothetical protein [Pyrinomonadaceae bacterium]
MSANGKSGCVRFKSVLRLTFYKLRNPAFHSIRRPSDRSSLWRAIDRFSDYVAQLNPLVAARHAGHGAHSATPQPTDQSRDAEHAHNHLSNEVYEAFAAVMESAARSHEAAVETIAAACHCTALSAASKAKVEQLSVYLRDNEPIWRRFLTESDSPIHECPIVLPEPARRHRCVPGQPQYGGQWEIASSSQ